MTETNESLLYSLFLATHSWLRWAVLILAVVVCARALVGWFGRRPWAPADSKFLLFQMIATDLQLLVGLVLYFGLSPITTAALSDMGSAMKVPALRFFVVEHTFTMLIALVIVHIAKVKAKAKRMGETGRSDTHRHRFVAISFLVLLALFAVAIPWPFLPYGRPLLRVFG